MEINLNDKFLGEFLLSGDCREIVSSIANNAQALYQSQVAKRTGLLAASAHAHTEIGGVKNDRWIGVMSVGGAGSRGTADYAASHEYGAGDHQAAEAVAAKAGKLYGSDAKSGSTGGHHNAAAHDMNRVLEELGGTVTTPAPNLITYPTWYRGGYPDIEALMIELFQPLLTGVQVVSWLPTPAVYDAQLSAGYGYLRACRTGGKVNYDQKRDEPRVQIAALTRIRDESWQMIEFVRQVLDAFQRGGTVPGTPTSIELAGEVVGPQLIPELIQDDRLVPVTFELHVPKPKGLPNYRLELGI